MNNLTTRTYRSFVIIALLIATAIVMILALNDQYALAQEYNSSSLYITSTLNSSKNDTYYRMSDIDPEDLTNVKYISNSAYFSKSKTCIS